MSHFRRKAFIVTPMRVGVTLPQFRRDAEAALDVARRAEAAGVDGIFVFDHLWPLGRPDRPALHSASLLGAVAAETQRAVLGTLVARVGLVPDAVLVNTVTSVARIAGRDRFIAGLGTGDRANRDENLAYGVAFPAAGDRLASLVANVRSLRQRGVHTWVGGLSAPVREAAAEADGWNGWGLSTSDFAGRAAGLPPGVEPTWAGQVLIARTAEDLEAKRMRSGDRPGLVRGTVDDLAVHLAALAAIGATWAVCAPIDVATDPSTVELVAEAAARAGPTNG